jgi:glycosyltransferase involved in cell wall biosynthesis
MKPLLIIPAFNESANMAHVLAEVQSLYTSLDMIVVDDGSSDSTSSVAERFGVKVLRLPFNLGYGAAVQTGLLYGVEAGYDACVLIDGDGQMDPRYISALLDQVKDFGVDLALGSRFLGKAEYSVSWGRKLGIFLFSKLASFFTRQQITDPTSGFQAIGRRLMEFFADDNYPDTIIRLYFAGFKIKEVPVTIRPRLRGKSMHTGAKTIYYIYKMFFSIFIALTQKRMLAKGATHATGDQDIDRGYEPVGDADDYQPRSS